MAKQHTITNINKVNLWVTRRTIVCMFFDRKKINKISKEFNEIQLIVSINALMNKGCKPMIEHGSRGAVWEL